MEADEISEDAFGILTHSADPPLVVVTTAADGVRAGCVVGFHTQSSMTPEHYCLWLSKANHTYRTSLRATHFAVHFLTSSDLDLARQFGTHSGDDTDKFARLEVDTSEYGVPVLAALPNRMLVERLSMLDDGGDHVCLSTKVLAAESEASFEPLRLSSARHLDPGHENEERAIKPE